MSSTIDFLQKKMGLGKNSEGRSRAGKKTSGFVLTLGLFMATVLFANRAEAQTVSPPIYPSDDTFLENGINNWSSEDFIRLDNRPSPLRVRKAYLKYDLSSINGNITDVDFNFRILDDPGTGEISVFKGSHTTWTESGLTNTNKPTEGSLLGSVDGTWSPETNYTIDLNETLISNGILTLVITYSTSADTNFYSKDSPTQANWPNLVVTYTPVDTTDPTPPTLTSSGQTETTVDLSWSGASDNVGVTGYKIFQGTTEIESSITNTNYTVNNLSSNTSYSFQVVAFDAAGNLGSSNTISVTTDAPSNTSTAIRINAGGPAMTYDGKQFDADQYFVGGSPYEKTTAQVPVLYQTERSGSARTFDYAIPVSNGDYDVILHFADIYWGATGGGTGGVGKRIFDVTLEGTQVLDDYDIYAEVGGETISVKNYTVTISDGELNLNFSSLAAVGGVDQAKVSAIEVVPSSGSGSGGSGQGGLWTASGANDIYFNTGHVGIGVTPRSDYMLAVAGDVISEKVRVELQGFWPDYVFKDEYRLPTLAEVQKQIQENGHLSNMPSAAEVEANGIDLGEMNKLLLEKVEELTLYIIQQDQRQKQLESRIKTLEKK